VLKVLWVHRVLKEILVAVVELVLKDPQVLKVHKATLEQQDRQVFQLEQ